MRAKISKLKSRAIYALHLQGFRVYEIAIVCGLSPDAVNRHVAKYKKKMEPYVDK